MWRHMDGISGRERHWKGENKREGKSEKKHGSYVKYFYKMNSASYIFYISNVDLEKRKKKELTSNLSILLHLYYYLSTVGTVLE